LTDVAAFEQGVFGLFALPDPGADQRLQIMTIHKAKGLEFDMVIIPGLGKSPRTQDPSLLLWQERAAAPAGQSLLMAPISETGAEKDAIYQYIQQLQQIRRDYETGRLLYVAATRAIKRLHLFGRASLDKAGGLCRPDSRSLLSVLWPAVREKFEVAAQEDRDRSAPPQEEPLRVSDCRIRRLGADCKLPRPYPDAPEPAGTPSVIGPEAIESFSPRFDWAGITLRHVGTGVHQWLRVICENGLENWDRQKIYNLRELLQRDLLRVGVCASDIEAAASQAEKALINAVTDHTGRWILSTHFQGACEYAVSGVVSHEVVNAVIDRTFVDDQGVRWVIDYKSGTHGGGGLADFLDREQTRYNPQMARYGELMKKLDGRPLRLGLYFPMIPAWRQWSE
ncbi:MAG: PD-(D/E)XK nuclease family protein, partial [Desulfobacterales bacterium]|nr:PD-(D/E)XK nuclease family protein [Desulfobacterales bacterium]